MVVIKGEAWPQDKDDSEVPPAKGSDGVSNSKSENNLYGLNDLANDYYTALNDASRPVFCKVIWIIIVVTMFVITIFMGINLISGYVEYNSFDEASTEWLDSVQLPAVTICSMNYINYTDMQEDLAGSGSTNYTQERLADFEDFLRNYTEFTQLGKFVNYIDKEEVSKLIAWEYEDGSVNNRFTTSIFAMLIGQFEYIFENIGKVFENPYKMVFATEMGMCLEVNDHGRWHQNFGGVGGGLTMDIDTNVYSYLFSTKTKGFLIFIRDEDETVVLNQGGYLVAPGTETFLKLTAKSVTRMSEPHGTCKNTPSELSKYLETYETVRECIQRQKMEAMITECGCIPWYLADRLYRIGNEERLQEHVDYLESFPDGEAPTLIPGYQTYVDSAKKKGKKRRGADEYEEEEWRDEEEVDVKELLSMARKELEKRTREKREETEEETEEEDEGPTPAYFKSPFSTSYRITSPPPIDNTSYADHICGFVYQKVCDVTLDRKIRKGQVTLATCSEPCAYNEWSVEMATAAFPSTEEYFDEFVKYQVFMDPAPTFEYARENMARIHIYYDDIKMEHIDQVAAEDFASFIGEFGGTVDLFIGFSFFTIFQLIEIVIATCLYKTFNFISGRKQDSDSATVVSNDVALKDIDDKALNGDSQKDSI